VPVTGLVRFVWAAYCLYCVGPAVGPYANEERFRATANKCRVIVVSQEFVFCCSHIYPRVPSKNILILHGNKLLIICEMLYLSSADVADE
jgi:hypothetical protein